MGKPKQQSPSVKKAKTIKKKYAKTSPGKSLRCRRAIIAIEKKEVTIRKASETYGLSYGYLQRRLTGSVEVESRNGPQPIFTETEEQSMAHWLKEMASRGMGLKPSDFLDFVQQIVVKEKKTTPFTNNRPGYDWYYAFMRRNSHIVEMRNETPLETCRAKLSKEKTDKWYSSFRDFLVSKGLTEKPECIWNADETGFSMGSGVSGKVIGPTKTEHPSQVPHLSGGHTKQRLTVMFCGSASGTIMPPYLVYPEPKPRGYNPLTGALDGSDIAYTKKGWMDGSTFEKFLDHFHKHAGEDRPVVLLIDSVSSHISLSAFEHASQRGIELYRIVPNATHLMQPLDVGVFGPLKQRWHQIVRPHTRNSPGVPIGKENFAEKLKDAFLLFYKPITVINAFRSSGIYPVDSTVITKQHVKPAVTFSCTDEPATVGANKGQTGEPDTTTSVQQLSVQQLSGPSLALKALESALTTPTKVKYTQRLEQGYDLEGQSPCFDVYKKLVLKSGCKTVQNQGLESGKDVTLVHELTEAEPKTVIGPSCSKEQITRESVSCEISANKEPACGLDLLAAAASVCSPDDSLPQSSGISPTMKELLTFPLADQKKSKRTSQLEELPDNLTSTDSIRILSLKSLSKIRAFAEKEKKAKKQFMTQTMKKRSKLDKKSNNNSGSTGRKTCKRKTYSSGKAESTLKPLKRQKANDEKDKTDDSDTTCMCCGVTWEDDQLLGIEKTWVQCDLCDRWIHSECSKETVNSDDDYYCYQCEFFSTVGQVG